MDCDYADSDDVLIDLIISGVRHKKIQERLLDQGQDITLKRAVEIGQQFELSQAQVKFMRGEEVLKSHKKHPTKSTVSHAKSAGTGKPKISKHNDISSCSSCGLEHEHGKCPAIGSTCSYCKQRNLLPETETCQGQQSTERHRLRRFRGRRTANH